MVNIVLKLHIQKLTALMYFLTAVFNAQVFPAACPSEPPRPVSRTPLTEVPRSLPLPWAWLDVDGFCSFVCFYLIQGFYAMTRFIFLLHMVFKGLEL